MLTQLGWLYVALTLVFLCLGIVFVLSWSGRLRPRSRVSLADSVREDEDVEIVVEPLTTPPHHRSPPA